MNELDAQVFRLWTKAKSPKDQDLFYTIDKKVYRVKKQKDLFYEEEKQIKKAIPKHKEKEITKSKSMSEYPNISLPIRKTLVKLKNQMKVIKDSTNNITKANSLYINKLHSKKREDEQPKESETLESLKHISSKPKPKYCSAGSSPTHKKEITRNFNYITNNYHKQLSKAFYKFNPYTHLTNLYLLSQVDPLIQKDIQELKKSINKDIDTITDKHYYKKRYENLKNKHLRRKLQLLETSNEVSTTKGLFKNQSTPMLKRKDYHKRSTIIKKRQTVILNKLNLPLDLKGKKDSLIERKFKEIDQLTSVAQCLHKITGSKNVTTNLDESVKDYELKKKFLMFEGIENIGKEKDQIDADDNKVQIKIINPFTPQLNNVNKMFGELHLYKSKLYDCQNIENALLKRVSQENKNLFIKQEGIKDNFIKEIRTQIKKAKLNIEI